MRIVARVRRVLAVAAAFAMTSVLAGGLGPPAALGYSDVPIEILTVPSGAMARDVHVEFLSGGPGSRALYLLDSMEAGDDRNGWDINTAAFDLFDGTGISVVMPVGGKSSFYSDWYGPAVGNGGTWTYNWETFLTRELPAWLAANRQVAQGGNAVVGLSMGGSSALVLAAYHPRQFTYAGALSGFLNLSAAQWPGLVRVAMSWNGGFNPDAMWGPPGDPAWARNDPTVNVGRLVANDTRIWVYCGNGTAADPALASPDAPIGGLGFLEGFAIDSNRAFADAYRAAGGTNAVFNFPDGIHSWGYWEQELSRMKPDLLRVVGTPQNSGAREVADPVLGDLPVTGQR